VIHVQRVPEKPKSLQVLVDGFEVKKIPYKDSWISLRQVVGKELVLSLPESHVELTASFEDLIFSLGVPSIKYGSKMEGLCGDCNGNAANDLQPNPAKKKAGVDVIQSWQADEPKLGLVEECLSENVPKEHCIPLPPEMRPVITSDCFCKCEACPKHQRLCPSSGDCIPEVLWCNGVRDCADDEDSSCSDSFTVEPEFEHKKNECKFKLGKP